MVAGLEVFNGEQRASVAARLRELFEPAVDRDVALPMAQLVLRMTTLAEWARGRRGTEPTLDGVAMQASQLIGLAELSGEGALSLAELRRMCASLDSPGVVVNIGEAGLGAVAEPGAILGATTTTVWWNFSRTQAGFVPRLRLSVGEHAALAAWGVTIPDPGAATATISRRWRRPLDLATESVILVCPRTTETGEPSYPHPLWDELVGTLPDGSPAARLVVDAWQLSRTTLTPRPLPAAADTARVVRPLFVRDVESASSLETLLGCSLAYVLRYVAELRGGIGSPVAEPGPLLSGSLAHHVLARVFADGPRDPDTAARLAIATFDAELGQVAETLCLPDHESERSAVRRAIAATAFTIADSIARSGATLRGVEVMLEGKLDAVTVASRADLLLSAPDHVIDYKWGASRNRQRLISGTAIQLAIYAELARTGATLPGAAYLILRTGRMLAAHGAALPDAISPTRHTIADTLDVTRSALRARISELAGGVFVAPSAVVEARPSHVVDGQLRLAPQCGFCRFDGLCGRRGRA
ncbi:MAG: PD-(D/E)XK nuclease family protein [Myxococcota bacterium]|nr:PD-(D/E)XK nuclease family protein [Myxococcota bacterium]